MLFLNNGEKTGTHFCDSGKSDIRTADHLLSADCFTAQAAAKRYFHYHLIAGYGAAYYEVAERIFSG